MTAIIAHGGARSLAPENTLAAARKAHALGADLWETDAAITADGQVVLMHDDAMMRTTDVAERFPDRVPAPFSTYTLAEIRTLDAGSWFERDDPFGQVAAGAVTAAELAVLPRREGPHPARGLRADARAGLADQPRAQGAAEAERHRSTW